jgi:primosomal protein N' (replication factor Y)
VIVLVPEIGLTPQTVGRFVERFGETVAVAHSRLGPASATTSGCGCAAARRGSASARARRCSRRSSDLGLIVVDEEHDSSYKHEGDPRYDARHVAARAPSGRARCCCAGSATPRPESYARLRRLQLPARVDGAACRAVEVLDMCGVPARCTSDRRRRSVSCGAPAARRSCCSTAAAGRTSSRAAPAARSGAARTATSRSSSTAPRA